MITLPQRVPECCEPQPRHATAQLSAAAAALLRGPGGVALLAALSRLLLHRYGVGWTVGGGGAAGRPARCRGSGG
ncbi:hypothetical protein AB8O53_08715, partial [Streptomyces pilosus]